MEGHTGGPRPGRGSWTQGGGRGQSPRGRGEAGTSGPRAARSLERRGVGSGAGQSRRGAARPPGATGRDSRQRSAGLASERVDGTCLDEGGFRVGEPVWPEPGPQGSEGTGLGGAPRSLSP